jgi:hypothetical protein
MSRLRAVKPEKIEKRLKAFFYGRAGVGKTTAAIQFPAPYLIDTEKGSENDQYIKLLEQSGGVIFQTSDFNEVIQEIRALMAEKHNYKTLVIDPMTILYNDLLDKCSIKRKTAQDPDGTAYGGHVKLAESKMKELINLLYQLDMNVIITSHQKNEYAMNGKEMTLVGQTFDCFKKMDYLFDLVIEIQKRGKERIGLIKKSRIEKFPEDTSFKFSYDEIANLYGREICERTANPIKLATPEQVNTLKILVDLYKEPPEVVQKWLDKAVVSCFEEMSEDIVKTLIDHMEKKSEMLKGKEKNTVVNLKENAA